MDHVQRTASNSIEILPELASAQPPGRGHSEERTDGGDGGDDLAKLQLVQDRSLTSRIESDLCSRHGDVSAALDRATSRFSGAWSARTMRIRISFLEKSLEKSFVNVRPMLPALYLHRKVHGRRAHAMSPNTVELLNVQAECTGRSPVGEG
jgi:hypothetical protein